LRCADPYGEHLRPLYNLQEDVALAEDLAPGRPADDDWQSFWVYLAGSLKGRVERFALVAGQERRLAGLLRFLPKTLSRPRYGAWDVEAHRSGCTDDVLWIGAAATDMIGYADQLPTSMLTHLLSEARRLGFSRLQALAWSDVPTYALWGQAFPWSVYQASGFRRIAELDGRHLRALPDMIAGRHGDAVRELVTEQLARAGEAGAESFAIVERAA
jgi:hypothetical protein